MRNGYVQSAQRQQVRHACPTECQRGCTGQKGSVAQQDCTGKRTCLTVKHRQEPLAQPAVDAAQCKIRRVRLPGHTEIRVGFADQNRNHTVPRQRFHLVIGIGLPELPDLSRQPEAVALLKRRPISALQKQRILHALPAEFGQPHPKPAGHRSGLQAFFHVSGSRRFRIRHGNIPFRPRRLPQPGAEQHAGGHGAGKNGGDPDPAQPVPQQRHKTESRPQGKNCRQQHQLPAAAPGAGEHCGGSRCAGSKSQRSPVKDPHSATPFR